MYLWVLLLNILVALLWRFVPDTWLSPNWAWDIAVGVVFVCIPLYLSRMDSITQQRHLVSTFSSILFTLFSLEQQSNAAVRIHLVTISESLGQKGADQLHWIQTQYNFYMTQRGAGTSDAMQSTIEAVQWLGERWNAWASSQEAPEGVTYKPLATQIKWEAFRDAKGTVGWRKLCFVEREGEHDPNE